MDRKYISVIFAMILVCFTCGAYSESESTETKSAATNSTVTPSSPQPIASNETVNSTPQGSEPCVIIEIVLHFNVTIETVGTVVADNPLVKPYEIKIDKNNDTEKKYTRSCAGTNQSLTMSWGKTNNSFIRFEFQKNSDDQTFMLSQIDLHVDVNAEFNSSNAKANQLLKMIYRSGNELQFKEKIGKSYASKDVRILKFTNIKDDGNNTVDVTISKVYLEAFRKGNEVENGSSNVIIIAVSAIAAVIVLSAVAFFIYRRRAQGQCIFGSSGSSARE